MIKTEIQQIWNTEIEILTGDIKQTINFIENKCDDETFCRIGEVFEDVAELTQIKAFVAAIKRRAEKISDAEQRRIVEVDIRFADETLLNILNKN